MPTINGTPGDDILNGTPGDDDIHGFGGNDGIRGFEGNDIIDGGDDHDFMRGNEGNDQIFGGNGDDYLDGGDGDDLLDGGSGWDRVTYAPSATGGVYVDLHIQGVAQDTGQGIDTLIGIEHLSGTVFSDTLIGDDGDNWLWGGSDGSGVTGNDHIFAYGGNDLVEVGTGNHILDGGAGIDTLSLFGNSTDITSAGVTVSLNMDFAFQDTEQGLMILSGFENLSGSIHDDFLIGNSDDNVLAGDTGNDQLFGANGNDTLYGDGRILVDTHGTGGSGPITTYSDVALLDPFLVDGDDFLDGGEGDDTLIGGGGSDTAGYGTASGAVEVDLQFGFASGAAGNDTLSSIENAVGSSFDDFIIGSAGANAISGGGGNDGLLGQDGDDVINGDTGHDFLRGGNDNDTLNGGDDDDFLNGNAGDDTLNGGAGWDRAVYSSGAVTGVTVDLNIQGVAQNTGSQGMDTLNDIEHVSGTRFDDVLAGNGGDNWVWSGSDGSGVTGNDTLSGGGGNDLVQAGTGNHVADGGTGIDTFSLHGNGTDITAAGVTVSLALQGAAQATEQGLMTLTGFENLSGSTFDDNLTGDGNDNLLAGDTGNDMLSGGGGADTLYGDGRVAPDTHGTGTSGPITTYADVATLDPMLVGGDDVLEGGEGDDILDGGGGSDTASYAHASGAMEIDLGSNFVAGPDGSDTLISIENVIGSEFDDVIFGDDGPNTITGLGGNDNLFGFDGADTLDGGEGHDFIRGGLGADTLIGGNGDDFLNGQDGDDIMDGGAGFDRASFASGAVAAVTVNLNIQGVAQDTGQGMDTLIGIEHASGTFFDDVLTGNGGDNWLWGISGNDNISGGGGNDLVEVGAGANVISGGGGVDTAGFPGDTEISAAGVTVSLALQGMAQNTEQGMMTLTGFENLSGSFHDDVFGGNSGANLIAGHSGNDLLSGADGDDTLYGDGAVTIDTHDTGGSGPIVTYVDVSDLPFGDIAGNDVLDAGKGDDTLWGGGGDDELTGGKGRDLFGFGAGDGDDVITDFEKSKDTIFFDGIAGVDDFGDLIFTKVGSDVLITWGTSDSILLEGMKLNQIHSGDFMFG